MASASCTRYVQGIRTASGLTPQDPTGWTASAFDFAEWRTEGERYYGLVASHVEPLMGEVEWKIRWEQLRSAYEELPGWLSLGSFDYAADIERWKDWTVDAACMLGDVEDALVERGKKSNIPPMLGGSGESGGGSLAVLLVIGGLAWAIFGRKGGE